MHITSGYYRESCGGIEVFVNNLVYHLKIKSVESVIVACADKDEVLWDNGIKVYKFKPKGIIIPKSKILYKYNRLLHMHNIFNSADLMRILKCEKPNLINVHMPRTITTVIFDIAAKLKIPIVSTIHERYSIWNYNPFESYEHINCTSPPRVVEIVRGIQRKSTQKSNAIVGTNVDLIREYKREGYYANVKEHVIPVAIPKTNVTAVDIINRRCAVLDKKIGLDLLYLGRLFPYKGIENLLEYFSRLSQKNIRLHIAGNGPLENLVRQYAQTDQRINFYGFVLGEEKEDLLFRADVLVFLPTEIETFGMVALEAMQHGLPVIASNVPSNRQLIDDRSSGIFIENEKDFFEAVKYYQNKNNLSSATIKALQKSNFFSYDKLVESYYSLYKGLVNP